MKNSTLTIEQVANKINKAKTNATKSKLGNILNRKFI